MSPNDNIPVPLNCDVHQKTIYRLKVISAIRQIALYKLVDEILTDYVKEHYKNVPTK